MAKLSDEQINVAFAPHLGPNEALRHWAFGVKQPSLAFILPLFVLAIVPGAIAVHLLTRNYLVGITDHRLIVLRVKSMSNGEVKEVREYDLADLAAMQVTVSTGALFTHIAIADPARPFTARFHRAFSKTNRAHAMAIAEAIAPVA